MIYYEMGYHPLADDVEKAIKELDKQNYGMAKDILLRALARTQEFYLTNNERNELMKRADRGEKP